MISPSDPTSAWTAERTVILDVQATPARTYDEVDATRAMLERTGVRFDLKPRWRAASTIGVPE